AKFSRVPVQSNASNCSGTWKEFTTPSSCLADSREYFLGHLWLVFTEPPERGLPPG
ncbi:hypothetical protein WA026_003933, partial [Henosepilachna vigintioctopunctata]